jgi:(3S)-malyl-CoA thioesterase
MLPSPDGRLYRSILFIPSYVRHKILKATHLQSDVVAFDLEEAVPPSRKETARRDLLDALSNIDFGNKPLIVRINSLSSIWGLDDLQSIQSHPKIHAICLPKVEGSAEIAQVGEAAPDKVLWICCETAKGIYHIRRYIPSHPNVKALIFGNNDFSAELGIETTDHPGLQHARSEVILAARANGMMVFDGPSQDLTGGEDFKEECQQARRLGFDGKLVIHPAQIRAANAAFSPTPRELEEAKAIIAASENAFQQGHAAFKHNNKLIEPLHVINARHLVLRAEQIAASNRATASSALSCESTQD